MRAHLTLLLVILMGPACGDPGDSLVQAGNARSDASLSGTWTTTTRTLAQTCWPAEPGADFAILPGNRLELTDTGDHLRFAPPEGPATTFLPRDGSWVSRTSFEIDACRADIETRLTVVGLTAGNLSAVLDQSLVATGNCPELVVPRCFIRTSVHGARRP